MISLRLPRLVTQTVALYVNASKSLVVKVRSLSVNQPDQVPDVIKFRVALSLARTERAESRVETPRRTIDDIFASITPEALPVEEAQYTVPTFDEVRALLSSYEVPSESREQEFAKLLDSILEDSN
jgi:hypothetical protein